MSQIDQVDAFSSAVGVRLRKVPSNDVLGLVRDLLGDLAFVGAEERVRARGYSLSDDDLCEVNADGQISSLLIPDTTQVPPAALAMLEAATMLVAPAAVIGVKEARALAQLPSLEHLLFKLDPDEADEVLAELARMRTLKSLAILNDNVAI